MSKADLRRESERHLKNKLRRKRRRDAKLQELETQLQFAESRCGTLKQQLDYIKQLYGYNRDKNIDARLSREEGHGDGAAITQLNQNELAKWNNFKGNLPKRENGDGPELEKQSATPSTITVPNSNNKIIIHEKREGKKKSPKPKANLRLLKIKKSSKKVKKRRRHDDGISSKVSNASSQTGNQIWPDPVVEIYKNSALKVESESGFEVFVRSKLNKPNEVLSEILRQKASSKHSESQNPDNISDQTITKSHNSLTEKRGTNFLKEEGMQTDLVLDFNQLININNNNSNNNNNNNNNKNNNNHDINNKRNEINDYFNKENTIKTESVYTEPVKSYCQPTISSKRKQIERDIYSNLNNLNIRQIPFIAAKSTAPSHNIGVNIQQVLSIIKKRQPLSENLMNANDFATNESPLASLLSSRKIKIPENEFMSAPTTRLTSSSESKKRTEGLRTSLSHWKSNSEIGKEPSITANGKTEITDEITDRSFKIDNLKKVLIFLHEDFTSLSQKYKRLQKKLTKRNISKTEAKDELANIERDLEKKEEEITVVISLYKEVLTLKEEMKKLQEKYNTVTCKRSLIIEGLRQSNSTHFQMTSLLRKIQNFQDKLKG